MAISTGAIGIDPSNGEVHLYTPPNTDVLPPDSGITVEWGQGMGLQDGQELSPGTYLIVSGTLVANGTVQAIPVTITGSSP
jgi:hypothetical protein